jgi:hypothetical protein
MDQVAGPIVASLDQPAGSVLDKPDGPSIVGSVIEEPAVHGFDRAILDPADIGPVDIGQAGIDQAEIDPADTSPAGTPADTSPADTSPVDIPASISQADTSPSGIADFDISSLWLPSSRPPPAWLLRRPVRKTSRKAAIVALATMTLTAAALAFTAVNLALKGFAADTAGVPAASAGTLVWPPPATAGGLPLHSPVVSNQGTKRAIAQFRRRFAVLLNGSTAIYPAALYNEPGRVDLVTGGPAWVMYLGFNENPNLADSAATVTRLMASLAGPSANVRPWMVTAGPAGGTAKCVVAIVGLTQVSVCGWATDGTIGALMSPTRDTTVSELAVLMSKMRPDLQPG